MKKHWTKDLTDEQNLWLHNLTNDIQDLDVINTLIKEYDKHQKENHYKSVMDILVHANTNAFKEVGHMSQALKELCWEIFGAEMICEKEEAVKKEVADAEAKKDIILAQKDAYIKQLEAQLGITTGGPIFQIAYGRDGSALACVTHSLHANQRSDWRGSEK